MKQLPKIVQQRLQRGPKPGVHPDPDLLAAFAEKSLLDRERSQVLRHLAECAECRDVLAVATPAIDSVPSPMPRTSSWLTWPMLRWGALAACVVVVSAAVTLHYGRRPPVVVLVAREAAAPASVMPKGNLPEESREKLATKIAPSAPFQADRDLESGKLAKKSEEDLAAGIAANQTVASVPRELDRMDEAQGSTRDRLARTNATNQPAPPAAAMVASAPVPAPTVQQPGRGKEPQIAESSNKVRSDAAGQSIGSVAETVMVDNTRAAPPRTPTVELKAKDEASKNEAQGEAQAASARAVGRAVTADRKQGTLSAAVASGNYADRVRAGHIAPRWTLSGDGVLQRSFDSGKTWQTIPVASNVVFLALAANDADTWVGGAAGALYHSSDAGQHWVQINPTADGNPLTGDIVTVEFSDAAHGKLTTSTRETWTTDDTGHTWHRY